jgi:hypothetical protein
LQSFKKKPAVSAGVKPVALLNSEVNEVTLSKPTSKQMSATDGFDLSGVPLLFQFSKRSGIGEVSCCKLA